MIKKNLAKAVMLGLCMATLSTGSAYAMLAETPASGGVASEQSDELSEKQQKIDKILFEDKAKDIEKRGFMVNYTGVVEDTIEIGISPYSEENATFLYDLVGKDKIKVVEMDQSIIYATGVAPDATATDDETDAEVIMYNDAAEDADQAADGAEAEDADKEVQIQIESTDAGKDTAAGEEKVYKTTSANTEGEKAAVTSGEAEEKNGVMVPVIAIAAIGLVGGAILVTNKKKTSK